MLHRFEFIVALQGQTEQQFHPLEVANGVVLQLLTGTKGGDKPNYLNAVDAANGELIWQVVDSITPLRLRR